MAGTGSGLAIANPIKDGRTLLYFEGAGQTTHVYVGNTLAGTHVGGYDEFVFDITDAVAAVAPQHGEKWRSGCGALRQLRKSGAVTI